MSRHKQNPHRAAQSGTDANTAYAAEPWVRKTEVATHLRCTVRQIEKLTATGLPSVKIGGMRRYRLSAVDGWLARLNDQAIAA